MDDKLTYQESLDTINSMIRLAKGNIRDSSFYFLLWGWVVAFCNIAHYILLVHSKYEYPFVVWLLTIPTAILSGVYGARYQKNAGFTTHYDRLYSLLWIAMGVSMVLIIIFGQKVNFYINPLIMLLAASGTFLSGKLLKFTPLVWGGVVLWFSAALAFTQPEPMHYLIGGVGIILGYLVPAYMLKSKKNG